MSSHHFVREGQEPALWIDHESPWEHPLFAQLTAWNPVVMCSERTIPAIEARGIAWDHALVSSQLEQWKLAFRTQPQRKFHLAEKDQWPSMVFEILEDFDCQGLWLLTDGPEAFHYWAKFGVDIDLSVITRDTLWVYAREGSFRKWLPSSTHMVFESEGILHINGEPYFGSSPWYNETDGNVQAEADGPLWWGEKLT